VKISTAEAANYATNKTPTPSIIYEIHLSQTYQVPVLYLYLINMPKPPDGQRSASMLEQIYKFVVPETCKDMIGGIGVMGGLSFTVSSLNPIWQGVDVLRFSVFQLCLPP
jgi:hypothetical protein